MEQKDLKSKNDDLKNEENKNGKDYKDNITEILGSAEWETIWSTSSAKTSSETSKQQYSFFIPLLVILLLLSYIFWGWQMWSSSRQVNNLQKQLNKQKEEIAILYRAALENNLLAINETNKLNQDQGLSGPKNVLKVGPKAVPGQKYVVKQGDNLWSISKEAYGKYDYVELLAHKNKLTLQTVLQPGQVLFIPPV
jgi:LysM repeat protein